MDDVSWYVENNFLKVWHMSYSKFWKAFGDGKITIVDETKYCEIKNKLS